MSDQPKIRRLLHLMILLSGTRKYSLQEIAERIGILDRSVYRYLQTFEVAGLLLERDDGLYRLARQNTDIKNLNRLFHFTEEEAFILYSLLEQTDGSASVKNKLIKKLHGLYDFKKLAQLNGSPVLEHIEKLKQAINGKKQVVLHQYRSSHSQTIANRRLEPFDFSSDYDSVWALDLNDKCCKQFLLSRIKKVEVLQSGQSYPHLHRLPFTDAFRMSNEKPLGTVQLRLTLKARNLLQEEFPAAMPYIKETKRGYELKIQVADYNGIGRFVLGLPEDVAIIKPVAFKNFLKERIKAWMTDRS